MEQCCWEFMEDFLKLREHFWNFFSEIGIPEMFCFIIKLMKSFREENKSNYEQFLEESLEEPGGIFKRTRGRFSEDTLKEVLNESLEDFVKKLQNLRNS